VIPTGEQLSDISHRTAGTLSEVPFGVLLYAHAVHERNLVLELSRRQVSKKIVFEGGVPVDCRSNLVNETLGRYMMAMGKLKEIDFTTCLGRASARGIPLGEQLVEQGLVTPVDLFNLLQQNLAKKLFDLFTWSEGEFRVLSHDLQAESSLKVKVPQLIVTAITRFAPQAEVDAAVGPLVGKRLALHPAPPIPLAELRLTNRQALLTDALGPRPRLDELAAVTGLSYDEITRLLYALGVIGVVVPADRLPSRPSVTLAVPLPKPPAEALSPAASPPAPVTPALPATLATPADAPVPAASPSSLGVPASPGAPGSPGAQTHAGHASHAEVERQGNEVMQAYLSYRKQDPFDLLGLADEVTVPGIEEHFLSFAARFAPWQFTGPLAGLKEKARDLFLAGSRAYGQLADREQRDTLLFRRKTLREERAKKPATFGIKTDLLDPEVQYRKGRAAMDAGKFREAILLLEFASDCDPQNGLYRAELAWSRVQASPATAAPQALIDLDEALRIDPKCGLAVFYLGEIHRELGNYEASEWHLQRAIKMMAPDRRPIEALKTLQARKRR
jgi:tetratricopeptide (TPR) repeat protein